MVGVRRSDFWDLAVSRWEPEQRFRHELIGAIADEHRLHLRAADERRVEQRWLRRAELAEGHGLAELAAEAGDRALQHRRIAIEVEKELVSQRAWVERLRSTLRAPDRSLPRMKSSGPGRLSTAEVERRLLELERQAGLQRDLDELRRRRVAGPVVLESAPAEGGANSVSRDPA